MAEIKVFRVTDYEWWAGESLEAVRPAFEQEHGVSAEDPDEGFDGAYELSPEQLATHTMHEWDEDFEDDHQPEAGMPTFQECLDLMVRNGRKFPCFFAGTEW